MFANRVIGGVKIPCVAVCIVAVLLIIAYWALIASSHTKDFLGATVIDRPSCPGIDGWWILHALFFFVIGLLYPGHYLQALIVSYVWEGVEQLAGETLETFNVMEKFDSVRVKSKRYWYGRFVHDPLANMIGYIIGSAISERYWPNRADSLAI